MKKLLLVLSLVSIPFCSAQNFVFDNLTAFAKIGKRIRTYYSKSGQKAQIHNLFPEAYPNVNSGIQMLASLEKFAIDYLKKYPDTLTDIKKFDAGLVPNNLEIGLTLDPINNQLKQSIQQTFDSYLKTAQEKNLTINREALQAVAALQVSIIVTASGGSGTFLKNVIDYALNQINN